MSRNKVLARFRFRFSLRFLLILTALVAIALVVWKPLLIQYHSWALDGASIRAFSSSSEPERDAFLQVYDSHLSALAQLEYYEKKTFRFQQLKAGSPESRDLLESLREYNRKLPLADRHTSSMGGYSPPNAHEITVWAKSKHMIDLTAIIESYDSKDAEAVRIKE